MKILITTVIKGAPRTAKFRTAIFFCYNATIQRYIQGCILKMNPLEPPPSFRGRKQNAKLAPRRPDTNSFESGCNFEQPRPGRGWYISQRARESDEEGRVRISGQISVPVVYEFLLSEGVGRPEDEKHEERGEWVGGWDESGRRRRMNRGGLINEIEVEDWRVIDERRGGISLQNVRVFTNFRVCSPFLPRGWMARRGICNFREDEGKKVIFYSSFICPQWFKGTLSGTILSSLEVGKLKRLVFSRPRSKRREPECSNREEFIEIGAKSASKWHLNSRHPLNGGASSKGVIK